MKCLFLVIAISLSGCLTHTLDDGTYQFSPGQVLRDDCMLQTHAELFTTGNVITTGDIVRIDYQLFGLQLSGNYKDDIESMTLEGLATNERFALNGNDCLLTQFAARLDSTTTDATHLSGSWQFQLSSDTPACVCQLWETTTAARQP